MNSWGILGNPTQEKITEWQNMPYGGFKTMVGNLKKKSKGNSIKKYKVLIQKIESSYKNAYFAVEAFTSEDAIEKAQKMDKNLFEWQDTSKSHDKYTYRVVKIE